MTSLIFLSEAYLGVEVSPSPKTDLNVKLLKGNNSEESFEPLGFVTFQSKTHHLGFFCGAFSHLGRLVLGANFFYKLLKIKNPDFKFKEQQQQQQQQFAQLFMLGN